MSFTSARDFDPPSRVADSTGRWVLSASHTIPYVLPFSLPFAAGHSLFVLLLNYIPELIGPPSALPGHYFLRLGCSHPQKIPFHNGWPKFASDDPFRLKPNKGLLLITSSLRVLARVSTCGVTQKITCKRSGPVGAQFQRNGNLRCGWGVGHRTVLLAETSPSLTSQECIIFSVLVNDHSHPHPREARFLSRSDTRAQGVLARTSIQPSMDLAQLRPSLSMV